MLGHDAECFLAAALMKTVFWTQLSLIESVGGHGAYERPWPQAVHREP